MRDRMSTQEPKPSTINAQRSFLNRTPNRSAWFSMSTDEHCVTSYDVIDWMWRGGFEFGSWLRARLADARMTV